MNFFLGAANTFALVVQRHGERTEQRPLRSLANPDAAASARGSEARGEARGRGILRSRPERASGDPRRLFLTPGNRRHAFRHPERDQAGDVSEGARRGIR